MKPVFHYTTNNSLGIQPGTPLRTTAAGKLEPITITITDQGILRRLQKLSALERRSPERIAAVCCRHGINHLLEILEGKNTGTGPGKKTVAFELPAEEYEAFNHAIRTFYAGTYYLNPADGTSRPIDVAGRACQLLRRDTKELLENVPGTRLNPNIGMAEGNLPKEPAARPAGGKIIPFMPHRAKFGWSIPARA